MPVCKHCGREFVAEDLVRHEMEELVLVHCPNCNYLVGQYNRHSGPPKTDKRS